LCTKHFQIEMEDELDYPEEDMDLMIDEELQVTEK
jgi:hypothetical protein